MAKILVLYHSAYGHIEAMAEAVAARRPRGRRHPRGYPPRARARAGRGGESVPLQDGSGRADRHGGGELEHYDAIVMGCGTRYGRIASQFANFLDQTGGLWARARSTARWAPPFACTASQHGGQETTLMSLITNMLHFGMVIVGLPYSFQGLLTLDEVSGGTPYGAHDDGRRRRLAAARARTNSTARASRAATWRRSLASCTAEGAAAGAVQTQPAAAHPSLAAVVPPRLSARSASTM